MKQGDHGDDVRRLQRALVARGFDLPRYGCDGDFGRETTAALRRFAQSKRYPWAPSEAVPDELLELLGIDDDDDPIPPCIDELDLEGVKIYDLRDECPAAHPKSRVRGGKTVMRGPAGVDSIVLHQTAVRFGGSPELKLARRSLRVACHVMAFYDGFVAWPVDLRAYIYHADRLNSRSLGLEVDGNYPGLIGGKVYRGTETPMTDTVVHAARMGVKLLVEEGRRAGMPIRYIFAHRQADAWRRADPGQGLYQRVVLEYAVPELGLEARPSETFRHPKTSARDGWPVPREWDADRGVGDY